VIVSDIVRNYDGTVHSRQLLRAKFFLHLALFIGIYGSHRVGFLLI
jgi:hypothetical protein